jgi:hypothetical protein
MNQLRALTAAAVGFGFVLGACSQAFAQQAAPQPATNAKEKNTPKQPTPTTGPKKPFPDLDTGGHTFDSVGSTMDAETETNAAKNPKPSKQNAKKKSD